MRVVMYGPMNLARMAGEEIGGGIISTTTNAY
jgi:hypothetical protein